MPKKFEITDNRTGKKFQIDWQGVNDPTDDDINEMLSSYKPAEDNTTTVTKPAEKKGFLGRLSDTYDGIKSNINKSVSSYTSKDDLRDKRPLGERIIGAIPGVASAENLYKDFKNRDLGAGVFDAGMGVMDLAGAKGMLHAGKVNIDPSLLPKPKVNPIVPDVPMPKPEPFVPKQLTDGGARFASHPSGAVGDLRLPDTPEALRSLDLSNPGTKLPDIELRPDQYTTLPTGNKTPFNFDQPGVRPDVEPFNTPRSQGIQNINPETGEVTSRDFAESNPLLSHVPNRLRPEAPNVTRLRGLSQGFGKTGDVGRREPLQFVDEANAGYDKPAKTVNIGEAGKKVKVPDVSMPQEMLPSAGPKGPISRFRKPEPVETKLPDVENPLDKVKTADTKPAFNDVSRGYLSDKKFAKANPVFDAAFQKWVKLRGSSSLIGKDIRNKFAGIKDVTKEDLASFQKDLSEGKHPEVASFFDEQLNKLKKNGIEIEKKENYLPQMWEDSIDEVKAKLGTKTLSEKAPFEYKSVFKDYENGIKAGLTPKMSPLELMDWYGQRANKLIADKEFLSTMKKNGYIVEGKKRTGSMELLDKNVTPGSFTNQDWAASPQVKGVIENYLKQDQGILAATAKGVGKANSMRLSAGLVPGKPLFTYHGLSETGRALYSQGFKGAARAIKAGLNPKAAEASMAKEMPQIIDASQKYGFKVNVENPNAQFGQLFEGDNLGIAKRVANKGFELQHKYFEKPLFEQMIPKIKWEYFKDMQSKFIKKGMSEAEAGTNAAKMSEDVFSGYNTDLAYRNKNTQNAIRTLTLAPDWYESSIKLGVKIPKAIVQLLKDPKNPVAQEYAKIGGRVAGQIVAVELLKEALGSKSDKSGQEMDIPLGEAGGKSVSIGTGQAADFAKIPLEIINGLIKDHSLEEASRTVKGKGSALTSLGFGVINGEDFAGNPNIFKSRDDRTGKPIPFGERAKNTLSQSFDFLPPQVGVPGKLATGNASFLEGASQLGELPLKFRRKAKVKSTFGF